MRVTFLDRDDCIKQYDSDCCMALIEGGDEVLDLADNIPEFWYAETDNGVVRVKVTLNDFSHFLDVVIYINDYLNGLTLREE